MEATHTLQPSRRVAAWLKPGPRAEQDTLRAKKFPAACAWPVRNLRGNTDVLHLGFATCGTHTGQDRVARRTTHFPPFHFHRVLLEINGPLPETSFPAETWWGTHRARRYTPHCCFRRTAGQELAPAPGSSLSQGGSVSVQLPACEVIMASLFVLLTPGA